MEFWGTLMMGTGCLIGAIYFLLKVTAISQRTTVTAFLGFDHDETQTDAALNAVGGLIIIFFVVMGYFVRGSAREYEKPPNAKQLGEYQQTMRAPAIDTPQELAPQQEQTKKDILPEINKSTKERDKEVNDYIQEAIRRSNSN